MTPSTVAPEWLRRIRSFVRRDSRMTAAQEQAFEDKAPHWCLNAAAGFLDLETVFGRKAPCVLEIGFGSGHSLAAVAEKEPNRDFIGVEMFKPGIGALFLQLQAKDLKNVRVYYEDAVMVLENCIPACSLSGLQLFFPDPWQKRKHHKRRLIQPAFVATAVTKLLPGGFFHLATDWQDYAKHMMQVLSTEKALQNTFGEGQFARRSPLRPLVTKFEDRGEKEGRAIWELQFIKI